MFQMHRVDLMTDTLIPDSAKRSLQVQGLRNGATIPRSTPMSHLNTSTLLIVPSHQLRLENCPSATCPEAFKRALGGSFSPLELNVSYGVQPANQINSRHHTCDGPNCRHFTGCDVGVATFNNCFSAVSSVVGGCVLLYAPRWDCAELICT
jgi:hypothetical protein